MASRLRYLAVLSVVTALALPLTGCVINGSSPSVADQVGYNAAGLYDPQGDMIPPELNAVADLGATWLRGDFNWPSIERSRNQFEWYRADELVTEANARGIKIMGQITYAPSWATDGNGAPDVTEFGDYARALAHRYASRGVHAWEIWNEANLKGPWTGTPDPVRYTAMLKAAYSAIHDEDPAATVVTSGLAPASNTPGYSIKPATFVQRIYENGGRGYFDAVGLHPYSGKYPATLDQPWNVMIQAKAEVYPVMQAHSDGSLKIWATESGYTTFGGEDKRVSEALQGDRIVEMIRTWLSYPFHGPMFVYALRNPGTDAANWHDGFGVLRRDFAQKPGYTVLRDYLRPAAAPSTTLAPATTDAPTTGAPTTEAPTSVPPDSTVPVAPCGP